MTDSKKIMSAEEIAAEAVEKLDDYLDEQMIAAWGAREHAHRIILSAIQRAVAAERADGARTLVPTEKLDAMRGRIAVLEAEVVAKEDHLVALRSKVDNCSCDYDALGPCMHHDEITKKAVKAAVSLLERENEALRKALEETRDELWAFRGYYIADHRLGLRPGPNPEVERASATIEAAEAALSKTREGM